MILFQYPESVMKSTIFCQFHLNKLQNLYLQEVYCATKYERNNIDMKPMYD